MCQYKVGYWHFLSFRLSRAVDAETPTPEVSGAPAPTTSFTDTDTPTPSAPVTSTDSPTPTSSPVIPTSLPPQSVTIHYVYDPLNRLTAADYSTGDYYHYTYDAVGNRLSQQSIVNGQSSTVNYQYDVANRLTNVNGVDYTWDASGNLLSDGVNTYAYDPANRLIAVSNQQLAVSYSYNGLGDRLTQNNIHYILDLNAGLTQVLDDGTNTYLYGIDRIAQVSVTDTDYFLGDALGSVRQLTDASGAVTLAQAYDPYGVTLGSVGSSVTSYGFTGEMADPTGLIYLRARYYSSDIGRFLSRDIWDGDANQPMSYNYWNYVQGNPVNYVDPTGNIKEDRRQALEALQIVTELQAEYNISIVVDWGYYGYDDNALKGILPNFEPGTPVECRHLNFGWIWREGQWSIENLRSVYVGARIMSYGVHQLGGNFTSLLGSVTVRRESGSRPVTGGDVVHFRVDHDSERYQLYAIIHEMGHVITYHQPQTMNYFMNELGAECINSPTTYCNEEFNVGTYNPGIYAGVAPTYEHLPSGYAGVGNWEDFAETFTVVVSEVYIKSRDKVYVSEARLVYNGFNHDIGRRRKVMKAILSGTWR